MKSNLEVNPAAQESAGQKTLKPAPVRRAEHAENSLTRLLEQQAAKVPSDLFLFAGVGSMVASLALEVGGRPRLSRFVGMWAPSLLIMGVYTKLVKMGGGMAG